MEGDSSGDEEGPQHDGALVRLIPGRDDGAMPQLFPRSWSRGKVLFGGTHWTARYHFGMRGDDWNKMKGAVWEPLEQVLLARDSRHVFALSGKTIGNVEYCYRLFHSWAILVRGFSRMQVINGGAGRLIVDAHLLNGWWCFMATPQSKGGRGSARDTMRQLCNSMVHLLIACRVLEVGPRQ